MAGIFSKEGIVVRADSRVNSVARDGNIITLLIEGGERVRAERLLVATGRTPNLKQLGVESLRIDPPTRWLPVVTWKPGRTRQAFGSTIVISPSIIFPVKVNLGPKMA